MAQKSATLAAKTNVYKVKFWGEYYTDAGIKGQKKRYEFDDIIMSEHERQLGFLHVFVRQILPDPGFINFKARAKYPDWKKAHTYHEDGVMIQQPDGSFVPIQEFGLMNRQQLTTFIALKKLEIEVDLYPTAAELKQAIRDYKDNQKAFLEYQVKRKERYGDKLQAAKNIRDLNDWSAQEKRVADANAIDPKYCIPKDLEEEDEIKSFLDEV